MSTQADQLGERAIVTGRAYVRMIEAADVRRLRGLVAVLPTDITGEILAASEKMTGPVRGFADK